MNFEPRVRDTHFIVDNDVDLVGAALEFYTAGVKPKVRFCAGEKISHMKVRMKKDREILKEGKDFYI